MSDKVSGAYELLFATGAFKVLDFSMDLTRQEVFSCGSIAMRFDDLEEGANVSFQSDWGG